LFAIAVAPIDIGAGAPPIAGAHLLEIYGTEISRETISKITDTIIEDMVAWQHRLCVHYGDRIPASVH
jgi:hypothetical protein